MVPTVCTWHVYHEAAAGEIEHRLAAGERMHVAAPALVEAYAVLTRLPPPYRLSASDALALLDSSFIAIGRTVALDVATYHRMLRRAPIDGIAGGRAYDVVIANCALRATASTLLTFNDAHFLPFAAQGLEVVVPARRR